jgi:DNA-directed RNA polymerase specialized sigma24 family protein
MTPRRKQHKRAKSAKSATPPRAAKAGAAPPQAATPLHKGRAKKAAAPKRGSNARTPARVLSAPAAVTGASEGTTAPTGPRQAVSATQGTGAVPMATTAGPAAAGSTAVADPPITAAPAPSAPEATEAAEAPDAQGDQRVRTRPAPDSEPNSAPEHTPQEAFDALYLRGAGQLVRQVELLTGDAECARQAVAHAYESAWQHWPEVARDSDPVGWVRAAAYEYAFAPWQRWRPGHRTPPTYRPGSAQLGPWRRWAPGHRTQLRTPEGQFEAASPRTTADQAHLASATTADGRFEATPSRTPDARPEAARTSTAGVGIEAALLELPPVYRKAVMLHDGLGIGLEEAAAEVEATTPAAAARVTHAREALAAAVPGLDDEAVPERLGALLGAEPEPDPPDRPAGVRDASERAARRRTVGAYALTAVIAAVTTVAIVLGPAHVTAGGQHGGVTPSPTGEQSHAAVRK